LIKQVRHYILRDYRSTTSMADLRLVGDNVVYVAETDVPNRSGYLWECEIEM